MCNELLVTESNNIRESVSGALVLALRSLCFLSVSRILVSS